MSRAFNGIFIDGVSMHGGHLWCDRHGCNTRSDLGLLLPEPGRYDYLNPQSDHNKEVELQEKDNLDKLRETPLPPNWILIKIGSRGNKYELCSWRCARLLAAHKEKADAE